MKQIFFATILMAALAACTHPARTTQGVNRLVARLEDKGMCSNYTFTIVSGNINAALVEASWTNPQTDKTFHNAFAISNPCDLPASLNKGDEFYFEIINKTKADCAVCMAYYPTPKKRLNIKVLEVIKK